MNWHKKHLLLVILMLLLLPPTMIGWSVIVNKCFDWTNWSPASVIHGLIASPRTVPGVIRTVGPAGAGDDHCSLDTISELDSNRIDADEMQAANRPAAEQATIVPASYVVWTDGGSYYATKGLNGSVDYRSTEFHTILNSVLAEGGVIALRNGTYTATGPIKKTRGAISYLLGAGRGVTTIRFTHDLGTNAGFYVTVSGCHWEQFTLDMNGQGVHAFDAHGVQANVWRDLHIREAVQDGIHLRASAERNSNKILDCAITQPGRYGIYLGSDIGHTWIDRCVISDTNDAVKTSTAGIYVGHGGQNGITNCVLWGLATAIDVGAASYRLKITDNFLTGNSQDIVIRASTGSLMIQNNMFWYVGQSHRSPSDVQSSILFDTTRSQYGVSITGNNADGQSSSTARNFVYCATDNVLSGVVDGNAVRNYGAKYNRGTQTNLVVGDNY